MEITKDVKLVKTDISVWLSTNHLLTKVLLYLASFTSLVMSVLYHYVEASGCPFILF